MIKNGTQKRQGNPCLFSCFGVTQPKSRQIQPKMRVVPRNELNTSCDKYGTIQVLQRERAPKSGRRRLLQKRQTVMKIQLILLLYDELLMGKSIERSDFCKEHKISERTFYRYLHELTDFLRAYKQAYIVDMREPGGRYYLKKIVDL